MGDLDEVIKAFNASIDREERCALARTAQAMVTDLAFELPLCEFKNVCLVRGDLIDVSSLYKDATSYKGPLSEIWNLRLAQDAEESEAETSAPAE